jgi:hypothetical protein
MSRTLVTVVKPPERVEAFRQVFGSATVPVRGWIVPHGANLPIGRRDVYELDLAALTDEQRARLIDHLASKFGVGKNEVCETLDTEGVAILADDCVVSSDGMDFL